MSVLDEGTVAKMATLSRMRLAPDEQARMTGELKQILDWVEQLNEVNTEGVEPMTSGLGLTLRLRPDLVNDGHYPEDVLKNAPERVQDFYVVPKVVE